MCRRTIDILPSMGYYRGQYQIASIVDISGPDGIVGTVGWEDSGGDSGNLMSDVC